jgi:hypothetical protein
VVSSAQKKALWTAIAAAAFIFGRDAHAEGQRTSSLAWVRLDGADGCIAAPTLARAVEERLRRKVFVSAADADITVEGSIGRAQPSGYRASIKVTGRDGAVLGTREVETRSNKCDAIDEKLALIVSVLIDPDADQNAPPPPEPQPQPEPKIIERERVVVVHEKDAEEKRPWRFELTLGAAGSIGLQPDVGVAFAPAVVIIPPKLFAVLIGGGISASTSASAEKDAHIDASLAHGSLSICPLLADRGRVHALACVGGLVGELRGHGVGFDTTVATSSIVAGPLVTGRFTLEIAGPFVAALGASLVVPIARAELAYRTPLGESTVFRTSSVAGTADLGLGVRLP